MQTQTALTPAQQLAQHILVMKDDAYLSGHPEWMHIIQEAKVSLAHDKNPSKIIEYCYPSSPAAEKAGFGKTGCYYVAQYKTGSAASKKTILQVFPSKESAKAFAESLPIPYNWMNYLY